MGPTSPAGGCAWKKGDQIKGRKKRETLKREKGPREDQGRTGEESKPCSCTYTGHRKELAWDPTSEKSEAAGRVKMPSLRRSGAVRAAFIAVHYHRRSLEPDSDSRNEGMDAQRGQATNQGHTQQVRGKSWTQAGIFNNAGNVLPGML